MMASRQEELEFVDWFSPREADEQISLSPDEEIDPETWKEVQEFRSEEGADPPPPKGSALSPRMLKMRELGRQSKIPRKIWLRLLAAAELDDLRGQDNKIGMSLLYEDFCKNGNKLWIDPLEELKVIMDNLEKFQGEIRHLRSFIFLLVQLARSKISPGAFLRYVLLPRMNFDYDYRSWREKNFWALEKIALGLIDLRQKPPFNGTFLGKNRVLIENVLAKYVGKPLARFRISELEADDKLQRYFAAWSRLKFESPFFLEFCRVNIFPFLYRLSGKVDLIQWVYVMNLVVELEKAIEQYLPQITGALHKAVLSFSLYTSFEENMMARQEKGQRPYDMIRELKAFIQSSIALLATNNGAYLISWLASVLHNAKDPDLAEGMARLLALIRDDGGINKIKKHLLHFQKLAVSQREKFLEDVYTNNGVHPDVEVLENPLGSPESLWPLPLTPDEEKAAAEAKYRSIWDRQIPARRPLSFPVLNLARQKIRLDYWQRLYLILQDGPQPPANLLPLIQKFLDVGKKSPQPHHQNHLRIAGYLAKNIPFLNKNETDLAGLVCSVLFARFDESSWSLLAGCLLLNLLEDDQNRAYRKIVIEDTSLERPSLQHYRDMVVFFHELILGLQNGWARIFRHVRPAVREMIQKFFPGDRSLDQVLVKSLSKLLKLDEINLDRAKIWDSLCASEVQGSQVLELIHYQLGDQSWKTVVKVKNGLVLLRSLWKFDSGVWTLKTLEGSGSLLLNWGQNDYLRLWARLRSLWENWASTQGLRVCLDSGKWEWKLLGELPLAIARLEQRLNLDTSMLRAGDAEKLIETLK